MTIRDRPREGLACELFYRTSGAGPPRSVWARPLKLYYNGA